MSQALSPRDAKRLEKQRAAQAAPATVIPSFRPNGTVFDLANPIAADIDFSDMADSLSKIARFNGIYPGEAYSVAQHSVMGADALFRETGDAVLSGYFALHDGHEYRLGDWTRPAVDLLQFHVGQLMKEWKIGEASTAFADRLVHEAIVAAKRPLDLAIYAAAQLPDIRMMPLYARRVKEMDDRMLRAEGLALFGSQAAAHLPAAGLPPPKLIGAIRPWGPEKAREAFLNRLERYLGIVARAS